MCWERLRVGDGLTRPCVGKSDGSRVIGSTVMVATITSPPAGDSRGFVCSFHEKQKVALESPLKRLIDEILAPDATYT